VKENLQTGPHPDADELSTFVEGAANAHGRAQMLAHLADCAECRRVVFLMQSAEEPEPLVSELKRELPWRRWMMPAGLVAAALACGLATVVYVRAHRETPEASGQNAQLQSSQPPQREASETAKKAGTTAAPEEPRAKPAFQAPGLTAGERTQGPASRPVGSEKPGLGQGSPAAGIATNFHGENFSLAGKGASAAASVPATNRLAPAPLQKAEALPAQQIEKTELNGRNFAALSGVPQLRIEHDHGPDDGTSEVAGHVTDQTGAQVPGATVTLRNASGQTQQTTSNADGSFHLAEVPPGHYELAVTARGFETYRQTMDLKPRDMAMLEAPLTVGTESETVTVQAEAMALQTESASVASVQESELPSRIPAQMSVTLGKRVLALDGEGALFLSRNRGRNWKKVRPQWTGKVARIQTEDSAAAQDKRRKVAGENAPAEFQLTTDSGAVWTSEDGTHWRAR
jgi:hypothetical protein